MDFQALFHCAPLSKLLLLQDDSALQPGEAEVRKIGCGGGAYNRDKNVRELRFSAVAQVLEKVVEVGGDVARYQALRKEGKHIFKMLPQ